MIELSLGDMALSANARNMLTHLEHQLGNLDEVMGSIGDMMIDGARAHIDSEADGSWPPPAMDYGHPLLRDTDALYNGFEARVSGDSVTVDNSMFYADYQDQGTRTIPARPFMYLDDYMSDEAERLMDEYLWQQFG